MKKYCIISISVLILYSCNYNNKQKSADGELKEKKTDSFFPVTSFIKGQIKILDSLPVTPLQITTIRGKTDSVWLPVKEMKLHLFPFLEPVITETNLTGYFKETRFNDQTINAITFTYDPAGIIPDSITLRHWDVYVDPEKGNILKVYIVKLIIEKSQSFTQQLTWQTDKSAKIATILNNPGGDMELIKEVAFTWSF